jgi:NTE family protein
VARGPGFLRDTGIFPPAHIDGHLLVDGGVACPVPAAQARNLGADIVVAVDLGDRHAIEEARWPAKGRLPSPVALWGRIREVQRWQIERFAVQEADLVIRPGIKHWRWRDFSSSGEEYREAGAEAARRALPEIERLLESPARARVAV